MFKLRHNKMSICVAGWYCNKDFYNSVKSVSKKYKPTVVSHAKMGDYCGLDFIEIENIGLEWGIYNFYLNNIWNGLDNVLFIHDDVIVTDSKVFDKIASLVYDVSYIFRDESEEKSNGGKHGRAVFMSRRFLEFVKEFECSCDWCKKKEDPHNAGGTLPELYLGSHKGFWVDKNNFGHTSGKPPRGVRHYNESIYHFHWFLGRVRDQRCGDKVSWPSPGFKMNVVNRIYYPEILSGRRGSWGHELREVKRYDPKRYSIIKEMVK